MHQWTATYRTKARALVYYGSYPTEFMRLKDYGRDGIITARSGVPNDFAAVAPCRLASLAGGVRFHQPPYPVLRGGSLPSTGINHGGFNMLLKGRERSPSRLVDSGPQDDEQNANPNQSIAHPTNRTRSSVPKHRPQ